MNIGIKSTFLNKLVGNFGEKEINIKGFKNSEYQITPNIIYTRGNILNKELLLYTSPKMRPRYIEAFPPKRIHTVDLQRLFSIQLDQN